MAKLTFSVCAILFLSAMAFFPTSSAQKNLGNNSQIRGYHPTPPF